MKAVKALVAGLLFLVWNHFLEGALVFELTSLKNNTSTEYVLNVLPTKVRCAPGTSCTIQATLETLCSLKNIDKKLVVSENVPNSYKIAYHVHSLGLYDVSDNHIGTLSLEIVSDYDELFWNEFLDATIYFKDSQSKQKRSVCSTSLLSYRDSPEGFFKVALSLHEEEDNSAEKEKEKKLVIKGTIQADE